MPLSAFGDLTVGAIPSINSGTPYNAAGNIRIAPYVAANLGYVGAPASVLYYFTPRDEYRAEVSSSTDLSANYTYRLPGAGALQAFVKADVLNLFDQSAIVNPFFINQAVLTNVSTPARFAAFNPFTETPVRGTHWDLGPTFGQATSRFAYQVPRTYRMSIGLRF